MQKINKIDKDHLEHYTCSICLEIFKEPLVITLCMHIFCKDCVDRYFDYFSKKFSIIECPNCRKPFVKSNLIQDKAIEKEIDDLMIICECTKRVRLVNYNFHINSNCTDYYEMNEIDIKKLNFVAKSLIDCIFCNEKNFNKNNFINHIMDNHQLEVGICPLCKKNDNEYKLSSNLFNHLLENHLMMNEMNDDDNLFSNNAESLQEEDAELKKAIEESMKLFK